MAGNFPAPEGLTVVKGKWSMGWREGDEDNVSLKSTFSPPIPQKIKFQVSAMNNWATANSSAAAYTLVAFWIFWPISSVLRMSQAAAAAVERHLPQEQLVPSHL